jgi:hypothetical protein
MVAVVIAALAAFLLAGVVSYVVNTSRPAIATSGVAQQDNSLSDIAPRTLRGGHQTMEGPSSTRSAAVNAPRRFGGLQP